MRSLLHGAVILTGALIASGEPLASQESAKDIANIQQEAGQKVKRTLTHKSVVNGWSLVESDNFSITHDLDRQTIETVAHRLEDLRDRVRKKWLRKDDPEHQWLSKCNVYIYPTHEQYTKETGVAKNRPGHSRISVPENGRVPSREICMYGDPRNHFDSVLPHEVTHVTLAGILNGSTFTPRWLDEGMAVCEEKDGYTSRTHQWTSLIRNKTHFSVSELFTMTEYPEKRLEAYYIQVPLLVEHLRRQKGERTLIDFAREAEAKKDYPAALKKHYGKTLEQLDADVRKLAVVAEMVGAPKR